MEANLLVTSGFTPIIYADEWHFYLQFITIDVVDKHCKFWTSIHFKDDSKPWRSFYLMFDGSDEYLWIDLTFTHSIVDIYLEPANDPLLAFILKKCKTEVVP
jgi:hypothetical protein